MWAHSTLGIGFPQPLQNGAAATFCWPQLGQNRTPGFASVDGVVGGARICIRWVAAASMAETSGGRPPLSPAAARPRGIDGASNPWSKMGKPAMSTIVPMLYPVNPGQNEVFPELHGRPSALGIFVPKTFPCVNIKKTPARTIREPSTTSGILMLGRQHPPSEFRNPR